MKGGNLVVACVAAATASAPFCAYQFRTPPLLWDSSLEDWLLSALHGGDNARVFSLGLLLCVVSGVLVGLVLRRAFPSGGASDGYEISMFRTPLAVAVLCPLGIATATFIAYNHTLEIFSAALSPDAYVRNWLIYTIAAAAVGALLASFLNVCQRSFEHASLLVKAGITCCLPLAVGVGLVCAAGIIGAGLLGGIVVGRCCGCPATAAWTGTCLASAVLAVQGGVFWPAYFPFKADAGR
jgi:hypothetical protein